MADILVRDMDAATVRKLKTRAARSGRSLQNEAKLILESAAGFSVEEARVVTRGWRRKLTGRRFGDSAKLVRQDRLR